MQAQGMDASMGGGGAAANNSFPDWASAIQAANATGNVSILLAAVNETGTRARMRVLSCVLLCAVVHVCVCAQTHVSVHCEGPHGAAALLAHTLKKPTPHAPPLPPPPPHLTPATRRGRCAEREHRVDDIRAH
jgi:hypothetical protein